MVATRGDPQTPLRSVLSPPGDGANRCRKVSTRAFPAATTTTTTTTPVEVTVLSSVATPCSSTSVTPGERPLPQTTLTTRRHPVYARTPSTRISEVTGKPVTRDPGGDPCTRTSVVGTPPTSTDPPPRGGLRGSPRKGLGGDPSSPTRASASRTQGRQPEVTVEDHPSVRSRDT